MVGALAPTTRTPAPGRQLGSHLGRVDEERVAVARVHFHQRAEQTARVTAEAALQHPARRVDTDVTRAAVRLHRPVPRNAGERRHT